MFASQWGLPFSSIVRSADRMSTCELLGRMFPDDQSDSLGGRAGLFGGQGREREGDGGMEGARKGGMGDRASPAQTGLGGPE